MGLISQKLYYAPTKAVETAMIYVDPPIAYALPGQNFTVHLNVANVTGLNTWEAKLMFDTEFLDIDSTMIKEGPFLQSVGDTIFVKERHPYYIWVGCVLVPLDTVNGSGILAYITFHVVKEGVSLLHLYETYLRGLDINGDYTLIPHTTQDGYVVPEFPSGVSIFLTFIAVTVILILYRRKLSLHLISNGREKISE